MRIIKLDAIDSTNTFLKEISSADAIEDFTVIVANHQKKGRGQMGTNWDSQKGKNLIVSVFKDVSFLEFEKQFYISIVTSLALIKTLESFNIPKLSIKWPNDILSADKKLCGVLIENVIKKNALASSVIGVGLNINQLSFKSLPKASSMQVVSGKPYDLDEILQIFLKQLKIYFKLLKGNKIEELKEEYEFNLFRKNKPSTFRDEEGILFSGFIKGISEYGNLNVLLEDDILKEFSLKKITLLY